MFKDEMELFTLRAKPSVKILLESFLCNLS
uniref:Uncharacterized protein n=1 Tax=Arundo donax TaxID=35708 RepID=A0A0A9AK07_ARUDO